MNSISTEFEKADNTNPRHPTNPPIIVIFRHPYLSTKLDMTGPDMRGTARKSEPIQAVFVGPSWKYSRSSV